MQMTNEEIIRHYREASDKAADINVLADLNVTNRNEIIAILENAGEPIPGNRRAGKFDEKIKPLYEQGLNDAEIARRLGCSGPTVAGWRKRNNIPVNHGPAPAADQADVPSHADAASAWGIYNRIETILTALPEDASKCVRDMAGNLTVTLFRDYVTQRLNGGVQARAWLFHPWLRGTPGGGGQTGGAVRPTAKPAPDSGGVAGDERGAGVGRSFDPDFFGRS